MKNRKLLRSLLNYSALLLIIILLFPTTFKLIHLFEKHEQNYCNENLTHIHQHELDCSICDFQISTFNTSFSTIDLQVIATNQSVYSDYYKSKKHNSLKQSFSLRGPPQF